MGKAESVGIIAQLAFTSCASFDPKEAGPMRCSIHDVPVQFRVNGRLMAAARAKAEREGMSLSELMRCALRREIAHAQQ